MAVMLAAAVLPALGSSAQHGGQDVTIGDCITTDWVNGWQDTGLRIKEWPIDGEVYAYIEVYSEDLFEHNITHRWMYDNGTGMINRWDWYWTIPEHWQSAWSYTYWQIGLDYGKGVGYIEVLADGESIGRTNWYAMDNTAPNEPTIAGATEGETGTAYEYTVVGTDPDGFDVAYFVDWGDGTDSGWTDFVDSGTEMTLSHTWAEDGDYTVKCKVKDLVDSESDWTTLAISMPYEHQTLLELIIEWILQLFGITIP